MMIDTKGLVDIFMARLDTLEEEFESIGMENPTDDTLQKMADNLGERHGIQWCINVIIDAMHASVKKEDVIDPTKIAEMLDEASGLIDKMEVLANKDDMTDDDIEEFFNSAVRVNSLHRDAERQINELEL